MSLPLPRLAVLSFALFSLANPRSANAELVLEFGRDGVPGVRQFFGQPGSELVIQVYLTQRPDLFGTEADAISVPDTRLTDQGVVGGDFDFEVDRVGLAHGALSSLVAGDGFSLVAGQTDRLGDRQLRVSLETPIVQVDDIPRFEPVFPPSGQNSVLLATSTLQLGDSASGDFQIRAFNEGSVNLFPFALGGPGLGETVTVGMGTATVTAVPEPSGLLGIAVASGLALGLRRYRSRGRRVSAEPRDLA